MAPKEAIDWCEQFRDNLVMANVDTKKRILGLQAMQTCISAIEKQIPKKPLGIYDENIYHIDDDDYIYEPARFGNCPSCNKEVQDGMLFCSFCGQALDWSDSE